jgi:hypothetical protein
MLCFMLLTENFHLYIHKVCKEEFFINPFRVGSYTCLLCFWYLTHLSFEFGCYFRFVWNNVNIYNEKHRQAVIAGISACGMTTSWCSLKSWQVALVL